MRVLLVKLSSLGDVVHTFPALTDALEAVPGLELDWAVEEALAPIARLHPAVRRVIPIPMRRLRRRPLTAFAGGEAGAVRRDLARTRYDVVIDAQGLMKSALVAMLARGPRHGFDQGSAREVAAAFTYQRRHRVPEVEHMVERIRKLFAAALGYSLEGRPLDTGLRPLPLPDGDPPHLVFFHGTTWPTKTWARDAWRGLAREAEKAGFRVLLFTQGAEEEARARAVSQGLEWVQTLPPQPLDTLIPLIGSAAGVASVDTGLGHLAAAFGVPTVGLYGPTNPKLTGLIGRRVRELVSQRDCAPCEQARCRIAPQTLEGPPCLADMTAKEVWRTLRELAAA